MMTNMKKCPYCAELIQDEAIICRFCNRDLPTEVIATPSIDATWKDFAQKYGQMSSSQKVAVWDGLTPDQQRYLEENLDLSRPPEKPLGQPVQASDTSSKETPLGRAVAVGCLAFATFSLLLGAFGAGKWSSSLFMVGFAFACGGGVLFLI